MPQMSTATVTPDFVNQPRKNPKFGSIKVGDTYYSVPVSMLSQFQPKQPYIITYETSDAGYHNVKTVKPAGGSASLSTIQGGKYGATDDVTAERIFCCGALNAFITAGKIEPSAEAVRKATDALRTAWRQTFGAPAAKATSAPAQTQVVQPDEPMDDEIPF